MAFITTKSVIVAPFVAATGGGPGMAGHRVHRDETQSAPARMAAAPSHAAADPDWSGEWYSVQRIIREGEPETSAVASF